MADIAPAGPHLVQCGDQIKEFNEATRAELEVRSLTGAHAEKATAR